MASSVEAVIAALRVVLDEAQKSSASGLKPQSANRWIGRLPRAWTGRWRHLKLPSKPIIDRAEFIGHVRAVIAYLEANREQMARARTWWPKRKAAQMKPLQAASSSSAQQINLLKARKPMPGVH